MFCIILAYFHEILHLNVTWSDHKMITQSRIKMYIDHVHDLIIKRAQIEYSIWARLGPRYHRPQRCRQCWSVGHIQVLRTFPRFPCWSRSEINLNFLGVERERYMGVTILFQELISVLTKVWIISSRGGKGELHKGSDYLISFLTRGGKTK